MELLQVGRAHDALRRIDQACTRDERWLLLHLLRVLRGVLALSRVVVMVVLLRIVVILLLVVRGWHRLRLVADRDLRPLVRSHSKLLVSAARCATLITSHLVDLVFDIDSGCPDRVVCHSFATVYVG